MPSVQLRIFSGFCRYILKSSLHVIINQRLLRVVSDITLGTLFKKTKDMRFSNDNFLVDGQNVPVMWCSCGTTRKDVAVLLLHGGGFTIGGSATHKAFAARVSKELDMPVALIDYRLAPEHPYPAAVEDSLVAYKELSKQFSKLVVMGDSAGGGLLFSLMKRLIAQQFKLPDALVAISPVLDLTLTSPSAREFAKTDGFLPVSWIKRARRAYAGDRDFSDPEFALLDVEYPDMPPLFITAAESEMLRDDSRRIAEKLQSADRHVVYDEVPDVFHDWPLFQGRMPEADASIEKMAEFVQDVLVDAETQQQGHTSG